MSTNTLSQSAIRSRNRIAERRMMLSFRKLLRVMDRKLREAESKRVDMRQPGTGMFVFVEPEHLVVFKHGKRTRIKRTYST